MLNEKLKDNLDLSEGEDSDDIRVFSSQSGQQNNNQNLYNVLSVDHGDYEELNDDSHYISGHNKWDNIVEKYDNLKTKYENKFQPEIDYFKTKYKSNAFDDDFFNQPESDIQYKSYNKYDNNYDTIGDKFYNTGDYFSNKYASNAFDSAFDNDFFNEPMYQQRY